MPQHLPSQSRDSPHLGGWMNPTSRGRHCGREVGLHMARQDQNLDGVDVLTLAQSRGQLFIGQGPKH